MSINFDDTEGMPHVVILKGEFQLQVVDFTGKDAREKAHDYALLATRNFDGCITVAVRVRQLCPFKQRHLMT